MNSCNDGNRILCNNKCNRMIKYNIIDAELLLNADVVVPQIRPPPTLPLLTSFKISLFASHFMLYVLHY
jgi:hypothetical protein